MEQQKKEKNPEMGEFPLLSPVRTTVAQKKRFALPCPAEVTDEKLWTNSIILVFERGEVLFFRRIVDTKPQCRYI